MIKTAAMNHTQNIHEFLQTANGEVLPYGQIFDLLAQSLPFTEAVVVSSLPRGGLQIVQPPRLPEALMRSYSRDLHAHDRLTWRVIAQERPARARDAWGEPNQRLEDSRFYQEFMLANGLTYAAAAPLSSPVLDGYAGAVHVYRSAGQGPFQAEELDRLGEFAGELDTAIVRLRNERRSDGGGAVESGPLHHRPMVRQFIFDAQLNSLLAQGDPSMLDERLRDNLVDAARRRFEHLNGRDVSGDRVSLPDSHADLWNFRVTLYRSYPALSDGPVVFFCLQPDCADWNALRPADFQADHELSRLLPALKFMREQFHRGPTLVEIARTVHLSPFHFHRRFTELLGITPKHFLLDCQIEQAKSELLARQKDLVKIATECGFAHQSHFTSRFKQATGLTPTRWRRMAQGALQTAAN
jgi:AraC-like DNA-binding protein